MKKLKKMIKLTNLNAECLNEKESNFVRGGDYYCGCFYAACGGSSRFWNDYYNGLGGLVSPLPSADTECGIVV